jgi:hypothetical protein
MSTVPMNKLSVYSPWAFSFLNLHPILQPPLLAPRGSGLAANLAYHLRMDDGILWHLSKARRILRRSIGLWRNNIWLVVSTPLKNISQLGRLFPIDGTNTFQTTNHIYICINFWMALSTNFELQGHIVSILDCFLSLMTNYIGVCPTIRSPISTNWSVIILIFRKAIYLNWTPRI